ncbi:sodium-hydrogen exchanger nhe1, putative [Ichthyophthirius multifiliis]|uniref:Sodium-hydrogen exchanger nhe1, putative n=1 Tax=Ichthyophthirius multifiliis TaxID=5932 RepID=G0R3C3_ICHMU|nr:sodium-hydrogen exchanger nhe1, putative [Ichthyophthirius multifiliis]EGR28042.1 sodium-hydrogen exchanger nhe1, putative [Ichthyophthirius multifiliis]|eukprot:XP_004027387.1 sodium-hydrogen exchanger nhe1, putative [Ichthyophthirius multifiliis]
MKQLIIFKNENKCFFQKKQIYLKKETKDISACILFMLFLLVINELIQHKLNYMKNKITFFQFLQPQTLTTLLGIFSGLLLNQINIFDIITIIKQGFSQFFLIILLPPMIYEQAINIEKSHFFKNIGSIFTYAILGTIISTMTVFIFMQLTTFLGLSSFSMSENLAFGSLISATNPSQILYVLRISNIDKDLISIIYGESILNDAVSIILYNTTLEMSNFTGKGILYKSVYNFLRVFFGSIFVGCIIGIFSAFVKYIIYIFLKLQIFIFLKMTILLIVPWFSYLVAQGLKMSGIVSILFCGITMAKYTLPNVSQAGQKINQQIYSNLSYHFSNIVFIFIGIGFVCFDLAWKQTGIFLIAFVLLITNLARFFDVQIVSQMLDKHRKNKIDKAFKLILWFSGFKGSTSYALSMKSNENFLENNNGRIMLTITLFYCILNVFFLFFIFLFNNLQIFIHASFLITIIEKQKTQFFFLQKKKNILFYFQYLKSISQKNNKDEDFQLNNYNQQRKGIFNRLKIVFTLFDKNFLQKILYEYFYQLILQLYEIIIQYFYFLKIG